MATTNSDLSLGGGVIRGTALVYDSIEHIKVSMDFLLQDFCYNPD